MTRLALQKAESLGPKMLAWDDADQTGGGADCQIGPTITGLEPEIGRTCLDCDKPESCGPKGVVFCWGGLVFMDAWPWYSMELTWCWR